MTNLNKTTINRIIQASRDEPFATFHVIVKDKLAIEEAFLHATSSLFNIEIISYGELVAYFKDMYRLNHLKLPDGDESLLFLKEYLETQDFTTFKNCSIATTKSLLDFIKMAHDHKSPFDPGNLSLLSKTKIGEFHQIYEAYLDSLGDSTRLGFEDEIAALLDLRISSSHFYFCLEEYTPRQDNLIKALAKVADVEILEYSSHSDSPLANHLETHFFNGDQKSSLPTPYHRLDLGVASMQYHQVAQAIFQAIKNNEARYGDFAIVTNNPADKEKMSRTLEEFQIPCNGAISHKNNPYLAVLALRNHLINNDRQALVAFLTNPAVRSGFGQYDLLEFKKTGTMPPNILESFAFEPRAQVCIYAGEIAGLLDTHFLPGTQVQDIKSQLTGLKRHQTWLDLADFFDLLLSKIEPGCESPVVLNDHVHLLDLHSPWLEILEIKQVYVLSCNEEVYPKKIKNNKILLDDELSQLNMPTIKDRLDRENRLILSLLASSMAKIVFCCGMFNLKSEPLLEASVLKNLFRRYQFQKQPLLAKSSHPRLVAPLYLEQTFAAEKSAVNSLIEKYQASFNQPDIIEAGLPVSKLSPSQIETYNSCPFKYFLSYHGALRPLQEAKIQANQTGTLIHHLIEQSQEFIENYDFAAVEKHLRALTSQFASDNRIAKTSYNDLLLRRIQEDMVVTLAILNKQHHQSHSNILATEKYVSLDSGRLSLHGKIDRVNVTDDYVAVVDYKGSAKKLDEKYLVLGVNIQMMVYLYMMAKESERKPGGVFYFNYAPVTLQSKEPLTDATLDSAVLLKEKRMVGLLAEDFADMVESVEPSEEALTFKAKKLKSGSWASSAPVKSKDELEALMNEIILYIEKLGGNLAAGKIPIAPIVSDIEDKGLLKPCTYCDYKAICKFDPFYNEYRNLAKEVKENESK